MDNRTIPMEATALPAIRNRIDRLIRERILILDGAHGTWFQTRNLTPADYGRGLQEKAKEAGLTAPAFPQRGNHDMLSLTRPDVVLDLHEAYLDAGADIISTNTFNANPVSQADYGAASLVPLLNREAVKLARRAVAAWQVKERDAGRNPAERFVAGSVGPTNKTLSLSREVENPAARAITFDELSAAYEIQMTALVEAGADILLVETVFDSLNARAALAAAERVCERLGTDIPVMVSGTVTDRSGRTLSGQTVEAFAVSIRSPLLFSIGLNCSFGAKELLPYVKRLAATQPYPVSVHPNAGLPDAFGKYTETPAVTAELLAGLMDGGFVNLVGGCCGTGPDHIRAIAAQAAGKPPRRVPEREPVLLLAGLEVKEVRRENNFLNIGERTNVAGSIKFARLIREGNYREALVIAREQVENGAQVIDVNVDDGLLDSKKEMVHFLRLLAADPDIAVVPVMVDSSDWEVLLSGLKAIQGKNIANSISLKNGETAMLAQAKEIRRLGAAVVFMAFDEQGQADTYERKIDICGRAYRLLTEKAGFHPEDIIFDPNILAVATGMPEHDAYALDYIRACRWIHENLPGAKVSGGVSNLSFSFRGNNRVREAMHAVFLYHAVQAGMDMGIVNPGMLQPYEEVDPVMRELCEDVVMNRRPDASERLLAHALSLAGSVDAGAAGKEGSVPAWRLEPVERRLVHALVKGIDDHVETDVLEALPQQPNALSLIEHVLMAGMKSVGDLFAEGKMFLPQVIRSARVMKKAVGVLLPFIEAENLGMGTKAGRVLLATVAGDVHDIGKNIVGVVLGCNNFEIIDLGVMVSKEEIIAKAIELKVDLIGCSGLITPSLEEMRLVAEHMAAEGLAVPLLVGGAATSKAHTALKIAPSYSHGVIHCLDASKSVEVASILCDPLRKEAFLARMSEEYRDLADRVTQLASETVSLEEARRDRLRTGFDPSPVRPGNPGVTIFHDISIKSLRPYINWSFFLKGWELQGTVEKLLADPEKGDEVRRLLSDAAELLDEWEASPVIGIKGAFGLFPAISVQEDVRLFRDEAACLAGESLRTIHFPRQIEKRAHPHLSLADFIVPETVDKPGGNGSPETKPGGYGSADTKPGGSGSPETMGKGTDWMGLFVVTAGLGSDPIVEAAKSSGDDYRAILVRLLCDRLAEASAEWMHQRVRREDWGYAVDESLSTEELFRETYRGIRPAPGYPACPDHALKKDILEVLDPSGSLGITLTTSNMMVPTASVSGFYFASPHARYFDARNSR